MPDVKAPRAYASNVMLRLFGGAVTLPVDLLPARRSEDESRLTMVCPSCVEPHKVNQSYACSNDPTHGPFEPAVTHRAIKVDGVLRKVTEAEIEALKTSTIEEKMASFSIFPSADVERDTMPSGSVYRVRPRVSSDLYRLLVDLVSDRSVAFVCELTLSKSQKMFRLIARDGLLTLTELIRPGELHDVPVPDAAYDGAVLERLTRFVAESVEPFNGEQWLNVHRERAAALAEAKRNPDAEVPDVIELPTKRQEQDGMAALVALLDSAPKAKKAPAKRAAKKASSRTRVSSAA